MSAPAFGKVVVVVTTLAGLQLTADLAAEALDELDAAAAAAEEAEAPEHFSDEIAVFVPLTAVDELLELEDELEELPEDEPELELEPEPELEPADPPLLTATDELDEPLLELELVEPPLLPLLDVAEPLPAEPELAAAPPLVPTTATELLDEPLELELEELEAATNTGVASTRPEITRNERKKFFIFFVMNGTRYARLIQPPLR